MNTNTYYITIQLDFDYDGELKTSNNLVEVWGPEKDALENAYIYAGTLFIKDPFHFNLPEGVSPAMYISKNAGKVADELYNHVVASIMPYVKGEFIYSISEHEFYNRGHLEIKKGANNGVYDIETYIDESNEEVYLTFNEDGAALDTSEDYVRMSYITVDTELKFYIEEAVDHYIASQSPNTSYKTTHVISDEDYKLLMKAKRMCNE